MIKPKEIKINNYFLYKGNRVRWHITDFVEMLKNPRLFAEVLKPIPITEKILEELGLKKVLLHGDTFFEKNKNERVGVLLTQDVFVLWDRCYSVPMAEFKHLHQLQNLYFALTSKELTFKE